MLYLEDRQTKHPAPLLRKHTGMRGVYLDADHLLWDVHHGVGQPALQALGKVADGLS